MRRRKSAPTTDFVVTMFFPFQVVMKERRKLCRIGGLQIRMERGLFTAQSARLGIIDGSA
jgi:hypothetical protein